MVILRYRLTPCLSSLSSVTLHGFSIGLLHGGLNLNSLSPFRLYGLRPFNLISSRDLPSPSSSVPHCEEPSSSGLFSFRNTCRKRHVGIRLSWLALFWFFSVVCFVVRDYFRSHRLQFLGSELLRVGNDAFLRYDYWFSSYVYRFLFFGSGKSRSSIGLERAWFLSSSYRSLYCRRCRFFFSTCDVRYRSSCYRSA